MSKVLDRDFAKTPQFMAAALQGRRDPEHAQRMSRTRRLRSNAELRCPDAAKESQILLGAVTEAYERAIQALRDVRHLLPPDGVAVVDKVVNCEMRDGENIY